MAYILAIDQGTTGTTSLIIDPSLNVVGKATVDFPQHFPEPSWVEHDLEEIWSSVGESLAQVLETTRIEPTDIAAIGITNQRETTAVWNRDEFAKPLCRAIVWQDRRTAPLCEKLKKSKLESWIHKKTGLRLDPYFSGTKLAWILKNVAGAQKLAEQGKLAFGTIDSFLLYRMTGTHATDVTNASRTLLMDLKKRKWDEELLKVFKIPPSLLPEIRPSSGIFGKTRNFFGLPNGIPVAGIAGDQQAALFGQACFSKGSVKCTYGTGAFILVNTGSRPYPSRHGLLTTVAWQIGSEVTYGIEGSAFIAGAAVQWIRDGLDLIHQSAEIESLARSVPDSDGVIFVPALSGLGAPYWDPHAKGMICGLTRRSGKAHLARATLDGIALQVRELLEAMKKDYGKALSVVRVDGGASANDLLMQIQADLLGIKVVRAKVMETTAFGAGLLAGLGVGLWNNLEQIEKNWSADVTFEPKLSRLKRRKAIHCWDKAVRAVRGLSQ